MIRPARVADVAAICALIRELAAYEFSAELVETTEDDLRVALFCDEPRVHVHVAEHDDAVVGAAVWFVNYSTWTGRHGIYLEDLVVSESARGAGHGRALVRELARLCVDRGYRRMDWAVIDWNTAAAGFYTSLGATPLDDWDHWRLSDDALRALSG